MQRKEVVELLRKEMPDMTDGPFDVKIESDGAGTHICIYIEHHQDASKIMKKFGKFHGQFVIVAKVPPGWLTAKLTSKKKD